MKDPIDLIRARLRNKTQREVAAELGISPGHLTHVLKGQRQAGPRLLRALGLERAIIYRKHEGC